MTAKEGRRQNHVLKIEFIEDVNCIGDGSEQLSVTLKGIIIPKFLLPRPAYAISSIGMLRDDFFEDFPDLDAGSRLLGAACISPLATRRAEKWFTNWADLEHEAMWCRMMGTIVIVGIIIIITVAVIVLIWTSLEVWWM